MSKINSKQIKPPKDYDVLTVTRDSVTGSSSSFMIGAVGVGGNIVNAGVVGDDDDHLLVFNSDSDGIGKRKTIVDYFASKNLQKQIKMDQSKDTNGKADVKAKTNPDIVPNIIELSDEEDEVNNNSSSNNNNNICSNTINGSSGLNGSKGSEVCDEIQISDDDEEELVNDEDDEVVIEERKDDGKPREEEPSTFSFFQTAKATIGTKEGSGLSNEEENRIEKLKEKNYIKIEDYLQIVINTEGDSASSETKENDPPVQEWQKDYKLKHFRDMIDSVLKDNHYSHLFDDIDWNVLYKFTHLSYAAQALYLRLLVRKSHWIRTSQMRYPDIENIQSKLAELVQSKLLLSVEHLNNLSDALNCLDVNEIKTFAKHLKGISLKANLSKASLMDAIKKHVKSSKSIAAHFMRPSGSSSYTIDGQVLSQVKRVIGNTCFHIEKQASRVFLRIALIRFPPTINDDDDSTMLSSELFNLWKIDQGELKYVPYDINKHTKVFPRRNNLILFEEACNLESDLMQAIEMGNHQMAIDGILPRIQAAFDALITTDIIYFDSRLPPFLRRFTSGHVLTRALSTCVTVLEQKKYFHEAVILLEKLLAQRLYCLDYRGKWFERLTLNYDKHLKRTIEAIEVIRVALSDTYVKGGHRYSLFLRAKKFGLVGNGKVLPLEEFQFKLKQTTIRAPALKHCIEGRKNIFVSSKDNGEVNVIPVEEVVIEYYKKRGFPRGIHCEGVIYNSLFCLLFWKIIYNDDLITSDAFHSPYQRVPLDLNFTQFYTRRQPLIIARLQELKNLSKEEIMMEIEIIWNMYKDCASLVNWDKCTLPLLKEIISCMKVTTIAAFCERLALDYRCHRSGFPDLLLWNNETKAIKAVEVKGPGDQVAPKQALWISYLEKHGLDTEICFVKVGRELGSDS